MATRLTKVSYIRPNTDSLNFQVQINMRLAELVLDNPNMVVTDIKLATILGASGSIAQSALIIYTI